MCRLVTYINTTVASLLYSLTVTPQTLQTQELFEYMIMTIEVSSRSRGLPSVFMQISRLGAAVRAGPLVRPATNLPLTERGGLCARIPY